MVRSEVLVDRHHTDVVFSYSRSAGISLFVRRCMFANAVVANNDIEGILQSPELLRQKLFTFSWRLSPKRLHT